jgi:hypothetical protein
MGKMKDLGQQLTEKLDWIYEEETRKIQKQIFAGIIQGGHYAGGVIQPQASRKNIKVDNPNQREAYVVPLSTLVNLWRAKFGDLWVDVSEIDDEFWSDASARLHRNKLMEEIEFRESNTPWARLREDA